MHHIGESQVSRAEAARVLVADDNPVNRLVARKMLERLGCRVDTVNDGEQAVLAAEQGGYALVLMDCNMPVMNGISAMQEIRRRRQTRERIPVVAFTAVYGGLTPADCRQAGFDDLLLKPAVLEDYAGLIKRWAQVETAACVA